MDKKDELSRALIAAKSRDLVRPTSSIVRRGLELASALSGSVGRVPLPITMQDLDGSSIVLFEEGTEFPAEKTFVLHPKYEDARDWLWIYDCILTHQDGSCHVGGWPMWIVKPIQGTSIGEGQVRMTMNVDRSGILHLDAVDAISATPCLVAAPDNQAFNLHWIPEITEGFKKDFDEDVIELRFCPETSAPLDFLPRMVSIGECGGLGITTEGTPLFLPGTSLPTKRTLSVPVSYLGSADILAVWGEATGPEILDIGQWLITLVPPPESSMLPLLVTVGIDSDGFMRLEAGKPTTETQCQVRTLHRRVLNARELERIEQEAIEMEARNKERMKEIIDDNRDLPF
jgi:Hsp70 protein